ncbi:HAD hydrolase-like protein [Desulfovibrio sp. OttesenSCG-928-G15]|nr:HAD hydrolase-like protein [Desulfovibrio sp. OttesenSCG-928-G15]
MALDLLVFDCDGVILESMDIKSGAFHRLGEEINPGSGDRLLMLHRLNGGVSRYKKFSWLFQEVFGRDVTDEEAEELNKKFMAYTQEEIAGCELVPGIEATLKRWHKRLPMFVASGAPQEELRQILTQRGLHQYFRGIYGAPTVKTQLLRSIVEYAGVRPYLVLMVGDSRADQYAAEACGTLFYGRGCMFEHTGHPWHEDLTQLNEYIAELVQQA